MYDQLMKIRRSKEKYFNGTFFKEDVAQEEMVPVGAKIGAASCIESKVQ